MNFLNRAYLKTIEYLSAHFPCVAILGARQVGKSTLLKQALPNSPFFDLEREKDWERVENDPEFFLQENPSPLIFDEAQFLPRLFPALRVRIDENRTQNGQYLISGSSSPLLLQEITETLAGRVAILELGPLLWHEAWQKKPSLFYSILAEKKWDNLRGLKRLYSNEQLVELCLYGGYPEPFLKREEKKGYDIWMGNYFSTYLDRDVRRLFPALRFTAYRRFIKMMAFSSGQMLNASNFASSLDFSQPTIRNYFEIAEGTFLWRSIPSYQRNITKRVTKMPRGHLRDSGLLNSLLNIHTTEELRSHPQFGHIWESFVIEQVIRSLQSELNSFQFFYYRTHNQAEIDLILEGAFGLIPIEIKTGVTVKRKQLVTLENFVKEHQCPCGILINNGNEVIRLSENIIQIPAGFL